MLNYRSWKFWALAVLLVSELLLGGCKKTTEVTPGVTSGDTLFYTNTSNTTPVFNPSSSTSQTVQDTAEWGSGNPLYSVYFSLREFLKERDEGVVDRSNLYKLLIDVDAVFTQASKDTQPITEQEITPPFSQLQKIICDKAINDEANKHAIALKETTTEINSIITWIWTDSPSKNEYGLATIKFNKNTGDITVDMTYSVDYNLNNPQTDYNLRCWVTGNAETHTFEFKYIIGDVKIVAKGISRGVGNYMLFKYTGFGDSVKYIVVPGDADEDFFIGENSDPTSIYANPDDLPPSVDTYKDWVLTTDFFTTDDMVTDISTLNSGNPREGTIYIYYQ